MYFLEQLNNKINGNWYSTNIGETTVSMMNCKSYWHNHKKMSSINVFLVIMYLGIPLFIVFVLSVIISVAAPPPQYFVM